MTCKLFVYEREHERFHLLNVSQLDEQTNPNSWRKVHLKRGEKKNIQILVQYQLLKDFEVAKIFNRH